MEFKDFYEKSTSLAVIDCLSKANIVIPKYDVINVSISGGSDSDIVLDIVEKSKTEDQLINYIWFDTGIEYQATKDHLKYLESKYGIEIQRIKAIKPIPTCVREYGVPFLSKYVSEMMNRLQKYNFKWEDKPFETLIKEYPKCISAIKWWCNCQDSDNLKNKENGGRFNISRNKWLKEFIIENPPTFSIDNKCCKYAKKDVAKKYNKESNADLSIIGVRKAEGGIRAASYKTCYDDNDVSSGKISNFRPIFWLKDDDKKCYEEDFGIIHSDCYKKYGLKRTGCVGCPYGRDTIDELERVIKKYEPKLYKACIKIFGASYEYTKQYREYCKRKNYEEKADVDQLTLFDIYYDFQ